MLSDVYFCLCIISGLYSSHTYAGRVLSGNLSSGSSSFVTIYQGGIAHFNIPLPVDEIKGISASAGGFASFDRLLITVRGYSVFYCSYI